MWILAFVAQIGASAAAIAMWSSKLTIRVEALEKGQEGQSGLALAVRQLETTMKRALTDIEHIMERMEKVQRSPLQDGAGLANVPSDVLARIIFDMAKPR